jgi:hypothetical protein
MASRSGGVVRTAPVKKRQRRLHGVDEMLGSLSAKRGDHR